MVLKPGKHCRRGQTRIAWNQNGRAGDRGPAGDPGLSTGPAGGDLTGNFPDPLIKLGAVTGSKVAANSLDGTNIDESTLGKVPSSTNSDAVGGLQIRKIRFDVPVNTPPSPVEVLNLGGLVMTAQCPDSGGIDVKARTTKNDATAWLTSMNPYYPDDTNMTRDINGQAFAIGGFDIGSVMEVDNNLPAPGVGIGTLHYLAPDGSVVVVEFNLATIVGPRRCTMSGVAIGG
jgi:hypothetical protein